MDAWRASSDAANAGDVSGAYNLNQQSLAATADANAAYSGTSATSATTGDAGTAGE